MTPSASFNARARTADDLAHLPAHRFERETGLTGIAADYIFPGGLRPRAFEELFFWDAHGAPPGLKARGVPEGRLANVTAGGGLCHLIANSSLPYRHVMLQLWHETAHLNPVLKNVTFDHNNPGQVYDALFGAVSGFNVDDINFFIKTRWVDKKPPGVTVMNTSRRVERLTGVLPSWVPSPATFQKIIAQATAPHFRPKVRSPRLRVLP